MKQTELKGKHAKDATPSIKLQAAVYSVYTPGLVGCLAGHGGLKNFNNIQH